MSVDQLDQIVARLEAELVTQYPNEAEWLILMTPIRRLWMGGYDVLGQSHDTLEAAADAQRAMIMAQLAKIGESE